MGDYLPGILWAGLIALVLAVLLIDLFVVSKPNQAVPPRKALAMTGVFLVMGLLFSGVVYFIYDRGLMGPGQLTSAGQPMTGAAAWGEYVAVWLLEYSMSVDNLFVFTLIFAHFKVPPQHQHRVLFWGIIGALVFRALMIGLASSLVTLFQPVLIVFGLILLWTAYKMLTQDEQYDPSKSLALRAARLVFPVTDQFHGPRFFARYGLDNVWDPGHTGKPLKVGTLMATPLFLVLCVVEATDVLFAVDSVPAAFGQSRTMFIIFAANVFAILGLRSLYFAIASLISAFRFLKIALAVILVFIGIKMILTPRLTFIPTGTDAAGNPTHWMGLHLHWAISLGVIGSCLAIGVIASLVAKPAPAKGD
jgi:tellurite resistance protein TerC